MFPMLDHTKPFVEKIRSVDAEPPGHAHKLDMKLQLRGCGLPLFAGRMLAKHHHFEVNWPTTLCENKDGVHIFALSLELYNRNNKLLLIYSKNGDIAWCNKNNLKKEQEHISSNK